MSSGVIIQDGKRIDYDTARFTMPEEPRWPPIEIRIVNDDGYGDMSNLEFVIELLNNGYKARWNKDICMWELVKDATVGG